MTTYSKDDFFEDLDYCEKTKFYTIISSLTNPEYIIGINKVDICDFIKEKSLFFLSEFEITDIIQNDCYIAEINLNNDALFFPANGNTQLMHGTNEFEVLSIIPLYEYLLTSDNQLIDTIINTEFNKFHNKI
jgi:hypothetical protein